MSTGTYTLNRSADFDIAAASGEGPLVVFFTITNTDGSLDSDATLSADQSWVEFETTTVAQDPNPTVTVAQGTAVGIRVHVATEGLSVATHTATITVAVPTQGDTTLDVEVEVYTPKASNIRLCTAVHAKFDDAALATLEAADSRLLEVWYASQGNSGPGTYSPTWMMNRIATWVDARGYEDDHGFIVAIDHETADFLDGASRTAGGAIRRLVNNQDSTDYDVWLAHFIGASDLIRATYPHALVLIYATQKKEFWLDPTWAHPAGYVSSHGWDEVDTYVDPFVTVSSLLELIQHPGYLLAADIDSPQVYIPDGATAAQVAAYMAQVAVASSNAVKNLSADGLKLVMPHTNPHISGTSSKWFLDETEHEERWSRSLFKTFTTSVRNIDGLFMWKRPVPVNHLLDNKWQATTTQPAAEETALAVLPHVLASLAGAAPHLFVYVNGTRLANTASGGTNLGTYIESESPLPTVAVVVCNLGTLDETAFSVAVSGDSGSSFSVGTITYSGGTSQTLDAWGDRASFTLTFDPADHGGGDIDASLDITGAVSGTTSYSIVGVVNAEGSAPAWPAPPNFRRSRSRPGPQRVPRVRVSEPDTLSDIRDME